MRVDTKLRDSLSKKTEDLREMHREHGFTLLEVLITVSLVGIISSISALQYGQIKSQSFDGRAISDLRNVMSAQEAYFAVNEDYVEDIADLTGFDNSSPAVTVILEQDELSWSASSFHPKGTTTYCYHSSYSDFVELDGINQTCPT